LPSEIEDLKAQLTKIQKSTRRSLVAPVELFEPFIDQVMAFKDTAQIFNTTTAFQAMVEITRLYCEFLEQQAGEDADVDMGELHEQVIEQGIIDK
jgi:hypothetical protein